MPISVTCRCGARYSAEERIAGKSIRCHQCGSLAAVPSSAADPEPIPSPAVRAGWLSWLPDWAQPMVVGSMLSLPIVGLLLYFFGPSTPTVVARTEARVVARTAVAPPSPRDWPVPTDQTVGEGASSAEGASPTPAVIPSEPDTVPTVRGAARTEARTYARFDAPAPSTFIDQTASDIGRTPTGIPLHMGPRGGVYHFSKSGRKVYHSRKK